MMTKRFRVRPLRLNNGQIKWFGGMDTGRVAYLSAMDSADTCGEMIDKLLGRVKKNRVITYKTAIPPTKRYAEH